MADKSANKKKNNRVVTIAVLAAALVILAIVYFALGSGDTPAPVVTESEDLMIVEQNAADITGITYSWRESGETVEMSFSQTLYKWQLTAYPDYPLAADYPAAMATAISAVKAERFVEDSDEHFADFGLDEPYLSITASYGDVSFTYNIGDFNQMAGGYYFNIGGTNEVYIIPSGLNPYFEYTILDMAALDTLPDLSNTSIFAVKTLEVDRPWNADELSAEKSEELIGLLGNLVRRGLRVTAYEYSDSDHAMYAGETPIAISVAYTEAQTVTNEDGSLTSTVHVDKTLDIWLSHTEDAAYLGASSGLIYACDAELTLQIFELLGSSN